LDFENGATRRDRTGGPLITNQPRIWLRRHGGRAGTRTPDLLRVKQAL
jgi:hypothetical protein